MARSASVCASALAALPPLPFHPPLVDMTPATPCWNMGESAPSTNELLGGELKGLTRIVSHELSASEQGVSCQPLVRSENGVAGAAGEREAKS